MRKNAKRWWNGATCICVLKLLPAQLCAFCVFPLTPLPCFYRLMLPCGWARLTANEVMSPCWCVYVCVWVYVCAHAVDKDCEGDLDFLPNSSLNCCILSPLTGYNMDVWYSEWKSWHINIRSSFIRRSIVQKVTRSTMAVLLASGISPAGQNAFSHFQGLEIWKSNQICVGRSQCKCWFCLVCDGIEGVYYRYAVALTWMHIGVTSLQGSIWVYAIVHERRTFVLVVFRSMQVHCLAILHLFLPALFHWTAATSSETRTTSSWRVNRLLSLPALLSFYCSYCHIIANVIYCSFIY